MGLLFGCFGVKRVAERSQDVGWRLFSLKELQNATNNFNYDNKLGEGSFGSVYWGQLWDSSQIAVKRLKVWSAGAESEFAVEVEVLGRIRHKNLLSLRGYCMEGKERLIVYNYMPNLSLQAQLHGHSAGAETLDWETRMRIAMGAAEGLAYLHHYATPRIIHRDVKSSNILLNADFEAQVADFGFAKLVPEGVSQVTTKVKGTLGYLAPEYALLGKVSEKCDVYSLGILLLELVSGRRPIDKPSGVPGGGTKQTIVEWAAPFIFQGRLDDIADPKLHGNFNEVEMSKVVQVVQLCAQSSAGDRPSMIQVVDMLKKVRDLDVDVC